ncbi:hypothetical protein [Paenibacillus sp. NPDC058174]|uniref:hypothetical protein n=1 Tax=Paenibacillus sp. NPDC058174 TaxID=3346366 RepID=UPI0036DC8AA7
MTPNLFLIEMYPTVSFSNEEVLGRLLDVFESDEKLVPTHWGNDERIKVEYNRNEIIEKVTERRITEIHLHRDKSIKYSGYFHVNLSNRSFLYFNFHKSLSKKHWSMFFEISDKISNIAKPRYGITNIFWPTAYPWNTENERNQILMDLCSQPVPVEFLQNGPLGVGSRTYFSNDVLELFRREYLKNSPGHVSEFDWGGICIDVIEKPWEADSSELLNKWLQVMKYLETSGAIAVPKFTNNRMGATFSPSDAWQNYLNR